MLIFLLLTLHFTNKCERRFDCLNSIKANANVNIICGTSTIIYGTNSITKHHITNKPAHGNAQYLRHFQQMAGKILNGMSSQFQCAVGKGKYATHIITIINIPAKVCRDNIV